MSLQKEKGLSPQKKNLKPKRESEASGLKSPSQTDPNVGAEAPTSRNANIRLHSKRSPILGHCLMAPRYLHCAIRVLLTYAETGN